MQRHDGQAFEIRELGAKAIAFFGRALQRGADLGEVAAAIGDRVDQAGDSLFGFIYRGAQMAVARGEVRRTARIVLMIFADEGRHHFGIEQLLGKPVDHAPFEVLVVDRAIVGADRRAALAKSAAPPAFLADNGEAVVALAALREL